MSYTKSLSLLAALMCLIAALAISATILFKNKLKPEVSNLITRIVAVLALLSITAMVISNLAD